MDEREDLLRKIHAYRRDRENVWARFDTLLTNTPLEPTPVVSLQMFSAVVIVCTCGSEEEALGHDVGVMRLALEGRPANFQNSLSLHS